MYLPDVTLFPAFAERIPARPEKRLNLAPIHRGAIMLAAIWRVIGLGGDGTRRALCHCEYPFTLVEPGAFASGHKKPRESRGGENDDRGEMAEPRPWGLG